MLLIPLGPAERLPRPPAGVEGETAVLDQRALTYTAEPNERDEDAVVNKVAVRPTGSRQRFPDPARPGPTHRPSRVFEPKIKVGLRFRMRTPAIAVSGQPLTTRVARSRAAQRRASRG